jgi:hypothetical protein
MRSRIALLISALALLPLWADEAVEGGETTIHVDSPMSPPAWAVLERELLRANTTACEEFFARYFDDRGYLECVERWGGDDGPDDAIENVNGWPVLHALGAPDVVQQMVNKAWEGHLRQFTKAKTVDVPFARDGMYFREFPVMFDWVHNGEGLTVFNLTGLSDPNSYWFQQRVRRFAGFYTGEDPRAPNYDPEHKVIRSMFNGSRGPLMRRATGLDWAGDPIEIEGRFDPGHGERTYEEMVEHFKDYNDIVGDHPQNLSATTLGVNAYMLSHETKYRDWVLDYADAWRERTLANGGIIPTKVGLDGKTGGPEGKWWGSVYGWGFTIRVPQTGEMTNRNTHYIGLGGFANALMLTGDQKYIDVWRDQIDAINAQGKMIDGQMQYPSMYGDQGWYAYSPRPYSSGLLPIYYWSMDREDLKRLPLSGWLAFLEGQNPSYPEAALQQDFATIRRRIDGMRADTTTPDTRLSDDPMRYNPATVANLVELMLGGLHQVFPGALLHCRLRYFDPDRRRAGVPDDVAALVEKLSADETTVTLVNLNQTHPRNVVVQGGAYGEHQITSVEAGGASVPVDDACFTVRLEPGAGQRLVLKMQRYANPPTLAHPWDRAWWLNE